CFRPWVAKLPAASSCCGQRGFRSGRDSLPFLLGDQSHNADRHSVGVGHVDCREIDPGIAQTEQKDWVSTEAVEPADDELGSVAPRRLAGPCQPGPIAVAAPAFDLYDLLDEFPVATVQPSFYGRALRFESEP